MSKKKAEVKLKKYQGIKVKWKKKYSSTVKKGVIIKQSPQKGTEFSYKNPVSLILVVSKGKEKIKVPQLVGMDLTKARRKVNELGIRIKTEYQYSRLQKGIVISQSVKKGEKVEKKSKVIVVVSKGKKIIKKQNVRKQAEEKGFAGIVRS